MNALSDAMALGICMGDGDGVVVAVGVGAMMIVGFFTRFETMAVVAITIRNMMMSAANPIATFDWYHGFDISNKIGGVVGSCGVAIGAVSIVGVCSVSGFRNSFGSIGVLVFILHGV